MNSLFVNTELMKNKLLNKFVFEDDLAANIYFVDIQFLPIQMNNGIKLIKIIEGELDIKVSFCTYHLVPGDFFLINAYELHSIKSLTKRNKIIVLELDLSLLKSKLFAFDIFFFRNFNTEIVKRVKRLMHLSYKGKYGLMKSSNVFEKCVKEIAEICDQYFVIQKYSIAMRNKSPFADHFLHNGRMKETYEYLYINMGDVKRLDVLSEIMNIDKCYASRLIKTGTGESFQEILNTVRVDRAELLLLGTDLSIQHISESLNFPTVYRFNRAFQQYFNMTPQSYRKACKDLTYPIATAKCEKLRYNEENHTSIDDVVAYVKKLHASFCEEPEKIVQTDIHKIMYDSRENIIKINDLAGNYQLKLYVKDEPINNINN